MNELVLCSKFDLNVHLFTAITAPGMNMLKVPLVKPHVVSDGVSILEWSGSALDEGNEAADWFTKFLGKTSRLVRFNTGLILAVQYISFSFTWFIILLSLQNL